MKYLLTLKHLERDEVDEGVLDEKLQVLNKHLKPPFVIDVVLVKDTHHRRGAVFTCRMSVDQEGRVSHGERSADSVLTAVDEVVGVLDRDLRRLHDKRKRKWGFFRR